MQIKLNTCWLGYLDLGLIRRRLLLSMSCGQIGEKTETINFHVNKSGLICYLCLLFLVLCTVLTFVCLYAETNNAIVVLFMSVLACYAAHLCAEYSASESESSWMAVSDWNMAPASSHSLAMSLNALFKAQAEEDKCQHGSSQGYWLILLENE